MLQRLLNSFKTDCKNIVRDPLLLAAAFYPLITILLLRFVIPPFSELIFSKTGFSLDVYYTIIAITLISILPALLGFIYALIDMDKSDSDKIKIVPVTPAVNKSFLYFRLLLPALISFIIVLATIILTDPVPSEGWLRSFFVTFLLSVQSPFVLLFIVSFSGSRAKVILLTKLYGIFLITVPVGLMLYHPWNYFLFFSPYYWISWAWVSYSPAESLFYGAISIAITAGYIVWFYTHLLKKNKT